MSTPNGFQPGDIGYTRDGRKAEFVARAVEGYVVRLGYHSGEADDEDFEYFDGAEIVAQFYREPPKVIYNTEIRRLDGELQAKREELLKVSSELREAEQTRKSLLAKLKQNDALKHLVEFIDGKITHFVVARYGTVRIDEAEKALQSKDEDRYGYNKTKKLLTLYGKTNGDLEWGLNEYSTGGSSTHVYPCLSFEEALSIVQHLFNQFVEQWHAAEQKPYAEEWVKTAHTFGFEIPVEIVEAAKERKRTTIQQNIANAEKNLQAYKAELAELD